MSDVVRQILCFILRYLVFPYRSFEELTDLVQEPHRSAFRSILRDHSQDFQTAKGSKQKHQAWRGGYKDHIAECLNIAYVLYRIINLLRPLPFTLHDALVVLWIHDLEKVFMYTEAEANRQTFPDKAARAAFREELLRRHNITLTPEQKNALDYVEGEHDYGPEIKMGPLAAFCHICDIFSARLFPEHPLKTGDSWGKRSKT